MPEKEKEYYRVIFTPELVKEATKTVRSKLPKEVVISGHTLRVKISEEERWAFDDEEEFFSEYLKRPNYASFEKSYLQPNPPYTSGRIALRIYRTNTTVTVVMPTRADVESVFNIFESNVDKCRLPEPPPEEKPRLEIKVFIGHGQNPQWRNLKDHLREQHGYDVEAYEIGARAGLNVKEVLEDMLTRSSFALLVFTGEDLDATGGLHARENVVHELGLFQGNLGWHRAIALLEDGVTEFSNIQGLNQIRFSKGNIRETFGEVVATIKREFPQ